MHIQTKYLDKKHGDKLNCPSCGMPGFIDIDTPAGEAVKDGAVWFNQHCGWECTDCCDK